MTLKKINMINGPAKTEAQYRAVQMDSSSSLKEFSQNRKKYYKKYILNEKVEEEDNLAATMGRVVETMLLEPEEFDNRFHMSIVASAPTGLMLDFVEALYKHTAAATNEDGVLTRNFEEICKDAYVDSGFKIKLDAVLNKFMGSDAEVYYKEIREVRSKGLTVVTTKDVDNATKIVEELKTNDFTAGIVNLVPSARYSIYNQLQIEGYKVKGHEFKSMLDKVVVDHNEKTIRPYDLKCTWSVENFYKEYYLYRRAYIQGYLYYYAVKHHFADLLKDGYTPMYPAFIVCDSTNYTAPLVYQMSDVNMTDANNGFEYKGSQYPGVESLIEDLKWAIENDKWNISRENYINNGVVKLG
jgi:hypothetical protein